MNTIKCLLNSSPIFYILYFYIHQNFVYLQFVKIVIIKNTFSSAICKSSSKLNDESIIKTKMSSTNKVGLSASRPIHLNLDRFLVTKSSNYPPNREIVRTSSERVWRDTAGPQGTMSLMSDKDSTPQTSTACFTFWTVALVVHFKMISMTHHFWHGMFGFTLKYVFID